MPAFEHAVSLGYLYVETDVHATADGVLVAFHDDTLDRVTDRTGRIAELPWSEVHRARVDGREPIPLLADLLGTWPHLRVNIDPKDDRAVGPLTEVIESAGAIDRVCVGSFSDDRLADLTARLGPDLCSSLGPRAVAALRLGTDDHVIPRHARCVQVPPRIGEVEIVDASFVATAHSRALQVHVWTIDDPAEMDRLLDLGVDGLMTDQPAVLRDVLETRGQWPAPSSRD
jgi:glycerophosphoryl diester phosphodiesterase